MWIFNSVNQILKILLISICIALITNCGYLEDRNKINNGKTEIDFDKALQDYIIKISNENNAITNWQYNLCGPDSFRFFDIFTYELEKLWLTDRPILFQGQLINISTINPEQYQITIIRDWLQNTDDVVIPRLEIKLNTKKSIIDTFLQKNPNIFTTFNKEIAVIGKINNIEPEYYLDVDEDIIKVFNIGYGELIDLVYLYDVDDPLNLF